MCSCVDVSPGHGSAVYANHPTQADLHNSLDCDSIVRGMAEGEEISSENMYANTTEPNTTAIAGQGDGKADCHGNAGKLSVPTPETETEF